MLEEMIRSALLSQPESGLAKFRGLAWLPLYEDYSIRLAATRDSSAALHAWAMQPPGRWGKSPSKISETCPRPACVRWIRKKWSCHALACARHRSPRVFRHAVKNAPISHGQTVP